MRCEKLATKVNNVSQPFQDYGVYARCVHFFSFSLRFVIVE